jgi:hypothetical protein
VLLAHLIEEILAYCLKLWNRRFGPFSLQQFDKFRDGEVQEAPSSTTLVTDG